MSEKVIIPLQPATASLRRKKMRERLTRIILITGPIVLALLMKFYGLTGMALFIVPVVGIPFIYGAISYPKFGVLVLLISAYLIMWIIRMGIVDFPLGTLMDGMVALLLLGLLVKQKQRPGWAIFKHPISLIIIIWILYNLGQFANPSADSRMAWLYTIRSVAIVMLTYFVFVYNINSEKFIRLIIRIWLALSVFAALYALKQEYIGFFDFEQRELDSSPKLQSLLFIGGHWRKFSIFSDPVAFSYNMVCSTLLCFALMWGPTTRVKKLILAGLAALFTLAMLYSGTRGAYVLIPASLCLWAILVLNKKVMVLAIIGGLFFSALVSFPTSNPAIQRFQSAFRPSEDASFNVRAENQKRIRPYIYKHPFGGGLGSTGVWGVRFSPYSFLASFPPDSGYVRVTVELGWVGALLFSTLMFIILKTGISNFFKIQDHKLKSYCLAMVLIIFALNIGNYPQEALVQFPTSIYFYMYVAIIVNTLRLDAIKRKGLHEQSL